HGERSRALGRLLLLRARSTRLQAFRPSRRTRLLVQREVLDHASARRSRARGSLEPPAEYPEYGTGYYAVFFADPDGLKLEAVHFPWGYWKRVQRSEERRVG